jgi:hypothetical protein
MSKEYELVFAGKEKGFRIDAETENVVVDGIPGVTAIPLWPPYCPKCHKPAIFQVMAKREVFCYCCGAMFEVEFKERHADIQNHE